VAISGDRILARDLAKSIPAFAAFPPEEELGYAPAAGVMRRFPLQELARLAASRGVAPPTEPVCVVRESSPLTAERLLPLLRQALQGEDASIEILDFPQAPLPAGELEFPISGLAATTSSVTFWRGRLRYSGGRSVPVWVKARVTVRRDAVTAAEDIPALKTIEAAQLRLETRELSPQARRGLSDPKQAVGKRVRRAIAKGQVIFAAALLQPREVEPGDSVRIESTNGGAHLEAEARAETAGSAGEGVFVRNLATGKRIRAKVVRKGLVKVDAS
jgi:flagella basal body P-ring formation protein FlgA